MSGLLKSTKPAALLFAFLFALVPMQARAAPIDEALALFASGSYSNIKKGIDAVAESGAPNAEEILNALRARKLYVNEQHKSVLYKNDDGKYVNAATRAVVEPQEDSLKRVRVNNALRNLIDKAKGTLILASPMRAKRLQAAESLFKARDPQNLEILDKAIAREKDAEVRRAFRAARAATVLGMPSVSRDGKLAAIRAIAREGGQESLPVLAIAGRSDDPEIKQAAQQAQAEIENRLAMLQRVQTIWYGLSLGSVLLLAAIGLAITFGVMGVINMAHGEMVMLGAYTTFVVQEIFRYAAPDAFALSLPVAIPVAFVVAGLVGIAIERGIIQFLYGRPLETLLATWGVSLVLQQAVRTIFGPTNRQVGAPEYMSGAFDFMGLSITYGRMWIIVFALFVFVCLQLVLRATPLGLQMRAVTQNRRMASAMGIRTGWVDAMTFGLGTGIAGIAGVALSQIDNVSPNLGQTYIIDSFMVVVFGGVGNLWGTLVSAFTLGVANKFLEPFAGAVLGKIFILVLLILFIQKRPRGMFALKGRAVEA